jgi:glutamyl endopeptidase
MSRSTKRVAVIAALALVAGLSVLTAGSPAASQAPAEPAPPTLEAITLPEGYAPPAVEAGTTQVSPAYNPGAEVATTPERNDGEAGDPLEAFAESVIGADGRAQIGNTTRYPARAIGQIEGSDDLAGSYICTGWLIDRNTILTAGHCVYPPTIPGNLAETLEFFPGRNGMTDPYGSCFGTQVFSPTLWTQNYNEYNDWAVVHLNCNIGDDVGWFGFFSLAGQTALRHLPARVQGYPGDQDFGTMWGMGDRIEASQKKMVFYDIDTYGGQSGSPVYYNRNSCGGPCGMAIHAYGNNHATGPHVPYNHAPRITNPRYGLITDIANDNG